MNAVDPVTTAFGAIETRLRTFFLQTKWDFHVVAEPMSIEEFKAIVRRTPCLALGWRSFNPVDQKIGRRFQGALDLRLTVVVKNPSGPKLRFLGDSRGPGLFPSLCGAIALINGFTVPGLGTFLVTAAGQAFAEGFGDHDMAIATIDIALTTALDDVTGDLAAAPDFLSLLSTFDPWPDGQDADGANDVRQP